jgi:probable phosphoglycerate mutase
MKRVLAPAIRYATEGFPLSPVIASDWDRSVARFKDKPGFADVFMPVPAGGGERRTEVAARVCPAIVEAAATVPAGSTLVVVTHGGSARAAIGTLLDLPLDRWAVVGGLANCCWSVLEETGYGSGGWRLVEHNAGSLPEPVMGDEE